MDVYPLSLSRENTRPLTPDHVSRTGVTCHPSPPLAKMGCYVWALASSHIQRHLDRGNRAGMLLHVHCSLVRRATDIFTESQAYCNLHKCLIDSLSRCLNHRGVFCVFTECCLYPLKHRRNIKKVPPRFELGSQDSKS